MKILLIPSAVLMPREMRSVFGNLPTALFPLAGKPMITHLYNKYNEYVDEIFVVGYERYQKIDKYINAMQLPVHLICLDKLNDLGYTLQYALEKIEQEYGNIEYAYINYADSLLEDPLIKKSCDDFAYFACQDLDEKWTYFLEEDGHITDICDKKDVVNQPGLIRDFRKIFIGSFGINNVNYLKSCLRQYTADLKSDIDSFYQAVQKYSQRYPLNFIESERWFDVGHNENYVKAKSSVAARAFNTIDIDDDRGVLTKTSENKEKLINEIRWYLRLPNQLQYLIPRIYNYSLDFDHPSVTMEFYGYHTLHESLLYGDLSAVKWKGIFKKLLFAIEDMQTYRLYNRDEEVIQAIHSMYFNKTKSRLEKLRNESNFSRFFVNTPVINGKKHRSINQILTLLPSLVDRFLLKNANACFSVIHGDLCFTNILVEDTYNFMRFIDPRGKFGIFDIYGDTRYELAKLFHTLEGHYDYIIEDMFSLTVNDTNITYAVQESNPVIWKTFKDVFYNHLNDMTSIRLIESTLFLSMIPLHSDYPKRQYAMLATGIELFDRVYEEIGNECR